MWASKTHSESILLEHKHHCVSTLFPDRHQSIKKPTDVYEQFTIINKSNMLGYAVIVK